MTSLWQYPHGGFGWPFDRPSSEDPVVSYTRLSGHFASGQKKPIKNYKKNNRGRMEEKTKHGFKDSKMYEDEDCGISFILRACVLCVGIVETQRKAYRSTKNTGSSLSISLAASLSWLRDLSPSLRFDCLALHPFLDC